MSVDDYESAVREDGPVLDGRVSQPAWDPLLGDAMVRRGRAVHEESVLDQLLAALQEW